MSTFRRTFFDFVNERGKNVIAEWLAELPVVHRARIQRTLIDLQAERFPSPTDMRSLTGGVKLLEVIVDVDGCAYRIFGYQGPGAHEVTLLEGIEKKGWKKRWKERIPIAQKRKDAVERANGRKCAHDFNAGADRK